MRIGWKKAGKNKNRLVKLQILGRVVKPWCGNDKLRTDKVRVLEIINLVSDNGGLRYSVEGVQSRSKSTLSSRFGGKMYSPVRYTIGKIVRPLNGLDLDRNNTCGAGINFFNDKYSAVHYQA